MLKIVKPFTGRAGTIKYDTIGRPEQTVTKSGRLVDSYRPPKTAGAQLGNKAALKAAIPRNRAPKDYKTATPTKVEKMVSKAPIKK